MIPSITFVFPEHTDVFTPLRSLLGELPNAHDMDNGICLTPMQPPESLPVTCFRTTSDSTYPYLCIGNDKRLSLQLGNLHINPSESRHITIKGEPLPKVAAEDNLGPYYERQTPTIKLYRLPMQELYRRLHGHIVRVDHTGLNIPSILLSKMAWQAYIKVLAGHSNLYNYPTGEDWPFILPATAAEYAADITTFSSERDPRFELVYDTASPVPTFQIDLLTDLPREEVERLFPTPYGSAAGELAAYFRSVSVDHDWPGLNIRFDIRYKSEHVSDWQTGKWLVEAGGRVR